MPNIDEIIAELRKLEAQATPGPWAWVDVAGDIYGDINSDSDEVIYVVHEKHFDNDDDPELIEAMRNALPTVLAELELLQKKVDAFDGGLNLPLEEIRNWRARMIWHVREVVKMDAEITGLLALNAELTRERDAAINDIFVSYDDGICEVCGRRNDCTMGLNFGEEGTVCRGHKFEWRGAGKAER